MRFVTTFAAAAALTVSGFAAQAGNPAPVVIEQPPVIVEEMEPAGSSISATYVVIGVLAALLIAAAVNEND